MLFIINYAHVNNRTPFFVNKDVDDVTLKLQNTSKPMIQWQANESYPGKVPFYLKLTRKQLSR